MIDRMKKWAFIGISRDVDTFLLRAQSEGCMEFIGKGSPTPSFPGCEEWMESLKILREHSPSDILPMIAPDEESIIRQSIRNHHQLHVIAREREDLEEEALMMAPFGMFSAEDMEEISQQLGRPLHYFRAEWEKEALPGEWMVIVNEDAQYQYALGWTRGEDNPSWEKLPAHRPLNVIEGEIAILDRKRAEQENSLSQLAAYLSKLEVSFVNRLNDHALDIVKENVESAVDAMLFMIEGWIPESKQPVLFSLLDGLAIHAEEIPPKKGEILPTHMINRGNHRLGEDLVDIYDTPSSDDRDPSPWVFWSFLLFFAMIISDAGYGCLYGVAALVIRWKWGPFQGHARRFMKLFTRLSLSTILWGVAAGSYFGLEISPDHPLKRFAVMQKLVEETAEYHRQVQDPLFQEWVTKFPAIEKAQGGSEVIRLAQLKKEGEISYPLIKEIEDGIFMEIALIVGMLHIALSLMRRIPQQMSHLGWVMAMIGAYLYVPKILLSTSLVNVMGWLSPGQAVFWGEWLFLGGITWALVVAVIQFGWRGLTECLKVVELFGDVLSYLRLYALGLAGMILASTFNGLAANMRWGWGLMLLFVGHLINMGIGVMGGFIHGLRLNFIEWYHHSFEGGGRRFSPLKLLR
ncbi:MAG: hypothetical protein VXZ72_01425 [Chlamydiota bacterium]|nr:hypothetical protein [Chlamydiota bacterium]